MSIFARHLADLHCSRGLTYRDKAIALATKGSHEDVLRATRLTRSRIAIARLIEESPQKTQTDIESVECYAVVMGMPRLAVEAMAARASLLLKLGETRHAAWLTTRSFEIAIQNDLRLRQIRGMLLLARIYEQRGQHAGSQTLRLRAYDLAEHSNCCNARRNIDRAFKEPESASRGPRRGAAKGGRSVWLEAGGAGRSRQIESSQTMR